MRDSEIRDIFLSAEEPVSPAVWDAVAAGLDARKKVVPFWMWGAMAIAAAAAVVLGVFLFRPQGNSLEAFTPSNGFVAQVSHSMPAGIVIPVRPLPAKTVKADVVTREETTLEAVPYATITPQALTKQSSRLAMPSVPSYSPSVDDNTLLNQLAYEEQPLPGRDISLLASGNVQASGRVQSFSRRAAASAQDQTAEGLYSPTQDKPGFPFSVGLGVKWNFNPRWAIGVGARYTNLSRSFVANYNSGDGWWVDSAPVDNVQHWIGVPVNVYFAIVNVPRFSLNAIGGGAMDFLLDNSFTIHGPEKDFYWHRKSNSLQWSANLGLSAEYKFTPWMGIYLSPGVRYYFNQSNGADINGLPVHPVRFVVEAGLRFSLGSY